MGTKIKKCTIISGAPNENIAFLSDNVDRDSFIICADSGYVRLTKAGIKPNLIIGDFDSSKKPDFDTDIITLPCEKAYCDTFECVQYAVENGYNDIEIFFALGSRFDHSFANVLSLKYCLDKGVTCTIIDDHNRLSLISNSHTFSSDYSNFSLFALFGDCLGVTISGAYYNQSFYDLDKMDIHQGDQFAVSNYIVDDECTINIESGILLLVESND